MKFRVTQNLDYVQGHLRYGHREGIIEAESLEEAKKIVEDDPYILNVIVDDYSLEDYDDGGNPFEFEEVQE